MPRYSDWIATTVNEIVTLADTDLLAVVTSGPVTEAISKVNLAAELATEFASADPSRAVNVVAASGATETLPATSEFHDVTMDEACEFTFGAPTLDGHSFILVLRGAFTPTFPGSVDWSGGAAPTYTTPSMYVFTTVDGGTNWLGAQIGAAFA
jgi:hypothetical protein